MPPAKDNTFSKSERLCGKKAIAELLSTGRWGRSNHMKYCWRATEGTESNRLLVSVPKKLFKRAVRRNLLKRRMREAYRTQKGMVSPCGIDIMLAWSHPEAADYSEIREEVAAILARIDKTSTKAMQRTADAGSGPEKKEPESGESKQ